MSKHEHQPTDEFRAVHSKPGFNAVNKRAATPPPPPASGLGSSSPGPPPDVPPEQRLFYSQSKPDPLTTSNDGRTVGATPDTFRVDDETRGGGESISGDFELAYHDDELAKLQHNWAAHFQFRWPTLPPQQANVSSLPENQFSSVSLASVFQQQRASSHPSTIAASFSSDRQRRVDYDYRPHKGLHLEPTRFSKMESVPSRILATYGPSKVSVQSAVWENKVRVHIATFAPLPATLHAARAEATARRMEVLAATTHMGDHVVRARGCFVARTPAEYVENGTRHFIHHIDAVVYEATENVEYVLSGILPRKDIDVLSALPFFVRQLLAMLDLASRARGCGIVFRTVEPSRIVIYRRADRSMAARLMDVSCATFASSEEALHVPPRAEPTADQWSPEGAASGLGSACRGRVTPRTDLFCVALIVVEALILSPMCGNATVQEFVAKRAAGIDALRSTLRQVTLRLDNGLFGFAEAALQADPSKRGTAASAARTFNPGKPLTIAAKGSTAQARVEVYLSRTSTVWLEADSHAAGGTAASGISLEHYSAEHHFRESGYRFKSSSTPGRNLPVGAE